MRSALSWMRSAVIAGAAVLACGATASQAQDKVTVGVFPVSSSLPYFVAVEKGYFKEQNIETGIHYPVPNHQQPAVTNKFGIQPTLPRTEQAVKEILSLPIHGEMPMDDVDRVCDAIAAFYGKA